MVERISGVDLSPAEFVRRYVAENTPVILEGVLSDEWAFARTWTPERIVALAPEGTRVRVAPLMPDGRDKWLESADLWPDLSNREPMPGVHRDRVLAVAAERIEVPIEDFAASLHGALPALYADGAANAEHSFHFLGLPSPPDVGSLLFFKRYDLWLGGKTISTLHYDNYENLFVQLVGDKEFTLFPPGDSPHLVDGRFQKVYATWRDGKFERTAKGISSEFVLNYAAYDFNSPPEHYAERAKRLRRVDVSVRAGDVLYLPWGWWHQVRGVPGESGLCASAAVFFDPFFVRLQPKSMSRVGLPIPNPKYRALCEELGLSDSDDDEHHGQ